MDANTMLVAGLLFGSAGIGYFIYGRRQDALIPRYCGIALMVFPYFVPDLFWLLGIGFTLLALPRFIEV